MKVIGERVRLLREKRGLSQAALAKKAGLNSSYINRLEKGERVNPSIDVIQKLAFALRTSMSYLIGETADDRPVDLGRQAAHDRRNLGDPQPFLDADDALDIERAIRLLERLKKGVRDQ